MREIVFDTETTGTRPDLGHRIIELGAVEIINGKIAQGKQWYFNPQRPVDAGAYDVHGLSDEFLADKPLFANCLSDILQFFADAPLVAHNADFDRHFFNHELALADYPPLPTHRFIDTLRLSRQRFKTGRHTLDALCGRFKIDISDRALHGALKDSQLLAQAYLRLTEGQQHSMTLKSMAETPKQQKQDEPQRRFEGRVVAPRQLDQKTIKSHRQFARNMLKDALWLQQE